ncbi:phosphodiester glycosidase family protein [Candidatus Margulisiibacteriota bacterium]
MKRKIFAIVLLCSLLGGAAYASTTLYRVRFGLFPDKLRTAFDFDGAFTYYADEGKQKIVIHLKDIKASPDISNYIDINDLIVRYLEIERVGEDLQITIPLGEPIKYNVFYLNDPPRLIIDFDREFLNIVSGGTIADGVEFLRVAKGTSDGRITAAVLKVDLDKAEVEPALARRRRINLVESFVGFIAPWSEKKEPARHFRLDRVSEIVADHNALAGINGTYFASTGTPLGALMIDRELISFSIYGRTAFFLDEGHKPYIDNIDIASTFVLEDGTRYKITGINEGRGQSEIIMYTPAWSSHTHTGNHGIEFVVANSIVKEINLANSRIPDNGFVLSVTGPMVEVLAESIRVGDPVDTQIKIIPYSTSPQNMLHLVSGGPRLLKSGRIYVSKHGERFKVDIAKGRASRTAIGITKERELLLVTVDGPPRNNNRQQQGREAAEQASIGVTLEELSKLMLSLGAVEAMNLDGGSSSTMVIENRVVNKPAGGGQRRVSNALVVRPKFRLPETQIR